MGERMVFEKMKAYDEKFETSQWLNSKKKKKKSTKEGCGEESDNNTNEGSSVTGIIKGVSAVYHSPTKMKFLKQEAIHKAMKEDGKISSTENCKSNTNSD